MRLWYENLLKKLPRQQLLGQHRECCALRGNGWGKKHATVNYVFDYSPYKLYSYHMKVISEMKRRGFRNDELWENPYYRGKNCLLHTNKSLNRTDEVSGYPEHDEDYLQACKANLLQKSINL